MPLGVALMSETEGVVSGDRGQTLAWRRIAGRGPEVVWLGGFGSQMTGTKASALAQWAERSGRAYLRFDYSGHGQSPGALIDGTVSAWREDALAVLDELVQHEALLVGSSMGAWLACLVALARPGRIKGLVLIAPAIDFTSKLLWTRLPPEAREALRSKGEWTPPPTEQGEQLTITRELLQDGRRWSILTGEIDIDCPVRLLQGVRDTDVPWRYAATVFAALRSQDAVFSLIKDGDHRLSRPQDLARISAAIEDLLGC